MTEQTNPNETLVIGAVIQPFRDNVHAEMTRDVLKAFNIEHPQADSWYPQKLLVDLYKAVEDLPDGNDIAIEVGRKSLNVVAFDEDITTIPDALASLNTVYHRLHRHIPKSEGWTIMKDEDRRYRAMFKSPYSGYSAYGFLYAILRRYRFDHVNFSVTPDVSGIQENRPVVFQLSWQDFPFRSH